MSIPGNLKAVKRFTFGTDKTWSAASTATATEQSANVPGTIAGRMYFIEKPTYQAGLSYCPIARCDADGTLKVQFINPTVGDITPTAKEEWIGVCLDLEIESNKPSASI